MVLGTAKLQLATGQHPAAMKDAVCSPGGATIKGVVALEDAGMRSALVKAIDATLEVKTDQKRTGLFLAGIFCSFCPFSEKRPAAGSIPVAGRCHVCPNKTDQNKPVARLLEVSPRSCFLRPRTWGPRSTYILWVRFSITKARIANSRMPPAKRMAKPVQVPNKKEKLRPLGAFLRS